MDILVWAFLLAGISGARSPETIKAAADRQFDRPRLESREERRSRADAENPFVFEASKPAYFIGCRPSAGECFHSCPRDSRVEAKRDRKLCGRDRREPIACYCRPK